MNKKCSKRLSGFLALVMMLSVILVGMPEVAGAEGTQILFEDFEKGSKGAYAEGEVVLSSGTWNFNDAVIGNLDNDKKNGNQAVRIRNGFIEMEFDVDVSSEANIKVKHANYGTNKGGKWKFQSSTDEGLTWVDVGEEITCTENLQEVAFTVAHTGKIRFKIIKTAGDRINIDDFEIIGGEPSEIVPIENFTISGPTEVQERSTIKLDVEYDPADTTQKGVTWTSSDETIATVNASGTVTGVSEGEVTITATSTHNEDISAEHTVNVTAMPIKTISEIRELEKEEMVSTEGIVTGDIDANTMYIQDKEAGIAIYKNRIDIGEIVVGNKVKVVGITDEFNGLKQIKLLQVGDIEFLEEAIVPAPQTVTIAGVNTDAYQGQLVEIKNVTIGDINTGENTPITDGDGNTINIYRVPTLTDIVEGDKVNVIAIASIYNTPQLRVRYAEDITKVEEEDPTPKPIEVPYTAEGEITEINPDTVIYEEGEFLVPEGVTEFSFKDGEKEMKASLVEDEWVIEEVKEEEPIPEPEGNYPVVLQNAIKTEDKLVVNLYNFEENMNGIVIIKVLDENNKPYIIDYTESMNITKGKNTVEFTLDSSKYKRGISGVKVYVWQSFDIMKPFARQKTFDL